ncbi:MAG: adenylate/guanylate cyclase domain-containing protein [Verrucomicrobia bacterium]|nr:MAG: adenylate/guanylate cyclase domain-containing protein [Verrucomicrobiota bacterium]
MERHLSAILAADVVGYSRLMGANEAGTLDALKALRSELIDAKIAEHQGRIVKLTGDGILAEFPSVISAVTCAVEMQLGIRDRASITQPDHRIQFRMGVNLGDVIVEGDDIYGDGVNVAARLESIAPPGGIAVSQSVRDSVGNRLDLAFEDRGEQSLKNIEKSVRVYHVLPEEPDITESAATKDGRPSIAVLPFNNMSGDPEQEYFSDGITEDVITDLSKVSGLLVTARNTSFTYKGKPVKVQQVGKELGVSFVVEGSVRKAGSRVRVTGQLIDARDGNHVWAERFDRDLTDIFAIQDEITHAIVEQLKVKLLPQEKRSITQTPTSSVEAYTYYLRGRQLLHRHTKSYYCLAKRMFEKAVELDPLYARAYAGIADCDSFLDLHYHTGPGIAASLANAERALALDDKLAEAHASRALALSISGRYEDANSEFERALALDPNCFEAHYFYARASFAQGNLERAAVLFERGAELKPDDYQSLILLIQIYRSLGRKERIPEVARKGLERAEHEMILHPEDPRPAYLGLAALVALGQRERAKEWILRTLLIEPDDIFTQYNVACVYTEMGETDSALDLLERFLPHAGAEIKEWIKHDSDFDPLRGHPRFQKLLADLKRPAAVESSAGSV